MSRPMPPPFPSMFPSSSGNAASWCWCGCWPMEWRWSMDWSTSAGLRSVASRKADACSSFRLSSLVSRYPHRSRTPENDPGGCSSSAAMMPPSSLPSPLLLLLLVVVVVALVLLKEVSAFGGRKSRKYLRPDHQTSVRDGKGEDQASRQAREERND